jgi:hypothetical protein
MCELIALLGYDIDSESNNNISIKKRCEMGLNSFWLDKRESD